MNWLLSVGVIILIVANVMGYRRDNSRRVEQQREYELVKISKNTSHYFHNFIDNRLEWLRTIALSMNMSADADRGEWWRLLRTEHSEDYQMGIADPSGTIYFGNHEKKDISDKEYFKRAMNGEDFVSEINKNGLNNGKSVILSVPIKDADGTTGGVVAVEYSTVNLGEHINTINDDWDEYGLNLVVNAKGEMVASYPDVEKYDTVFDMFEKMKMENADSLEKMREDIRQGNTGSFHYYNKNERRSVYYQPIEINDWSMVSIAAMKSNMVILEEIERSNLIFSVVLAFLMIILAITVRNIYRYRTEKLDAMRLDELTQIYRREVGEEIVQSIFERGVNMKIYGCLFIDVDDFKLINDNYGHAKGDEVLSWLGEVFLSSSRKEDIVYRYGGDEFCIWLCGSGAKKEILEIGNRILAKVDKVEMIHVSIGATVVGEHEEDWREALKRADKAVYEAKRRGKNQIMMYENIEN